MVKSQPNFVKVPRSAVFPKRCPACGKPAPYPVKLMTPPPRFIPHIIGFFLRAPFFVNACETHYRQIVRERSLLIQLIVVSTIGSIASGIFLARIPLNEGPNHYLEATSLFLPSAAMAFTCVLIPLKIRRLKIKLQPCWPTDLPSDMVSIWAPDEEWMRQLAQAPVAAPERVIDTYSVNPKPGIRNEDPY